jgi:ubiquinone/menaquinone biosynthesis C-methylase UbiE
MADASTEFAGSIPELYDRYLGPVMFEPYAADLARRVAERPGEAVLETACGTGILTRQLRAGLPASVRLVATDLNQPMLDYARTSLGGGERIDWQQADYTATPFPPGSFTALACQFGVMFVPDKAAIFREARRVLAPGGLLAFNVWDSLDANPYARIAQQTIASFFPADPPRFYDLPYGFGDPEPWRAMLDAHGFAEQRIEALPIEVQSPTAHELAVGLVRGTPMANMIQQRGGDFERIAEAVEAALAEFGGAAPFRSPQQAVVFTARAG